MILSFGYTAPALLAGAKTVTRRQWKPAHAEAFRKSALAHGFPVDAYDRSPRVGGRHIADLRVRSITLEPIGAMPDADYSAEGFRWLFEHGYTPSPSAPVASYTPEAFDAWRASGAVLYVVRFELIRVLP